MTVPLFREHEQRSAEHVACDAYYASGMYRMSVPPRGEDVARVVVSALAASGRLRDRDVLDEVVSFLSDLGRNAVCLNDDFPYVEFDRVKRLVEQALWPDDGRTR